MPKISVIITTYNRLELLKDSINSILLQSFKDFELLVIDDYSTDNTERVVKEFQDKRIFYIKHGSNRGDAAAKNTGIKSAKGEYLISLDDDDLMAPWALELLLKKIENSSNEVGGVYGWAWWIYKKGNTLRFSIFKKKGKLFKDILKEQIFTNILLKKEVFEKIGYYDESISSNYDHDLYLRLSQSYEIDFVSRILFIIRVQKEKHLSQLSRSHIELHQDVTRRYSPNAKIKAASILKILPISLYAKISIIKHKFVSLIRILTSSEIRRDIKLLKDIFKEEQIEL